MKRYLILLFCLLAVGVKAQTNTDAYWNITPTPTQTQAVLKLSNTVIAEPTPGLNSIILQQNGSNNESLLQTLSGNQNLLSVNQNGGDIANSTLTGSNNSLIIQQTGGGNAINMGLSGSGNRFMLTQDGGDTVNMMGLQKDNTRFELNQGSGNNSLTVDNSSFPLYSSGQGIPNLHIEQSGGASAIITQGKIIGN